MLILLDQLSKWISYLYSYRSLYAAVGAFLLSYIAGIATAAYIFFIERRIPRISPFQKIWYSFTFPLFDMIGRLAMIIALFTRVEWKPIPHTAKVDISEISTRG